MLRRRKAKSRKKKSNELPGSRVKLSFKRHFLPPLAGLIVAVLVFGFFNSGLISGKLAYYIYSKHVKVSTLDDQAAAAPIDKNAPPEVIINKINVKAPVIFDQKTVNEGSFQKALQHGVVHYPNTAMPGQQGNVVIFGHSSGQWWAPGDYKFVFTLLDKLVYGDIIFINYQGVHYIYRVSNISVVAPSDLTVLNQGGSNTLTLITCTPVGTSAKRLIIQAQQTVPKPADNTAYSQAASQTPDAGKALPSAAPSFWHNFLELFH